MRMHEKSGSVERLRKAIFDGVDRERLASRIFPLFDLPAIDHDVIPARKTFKRPYIDKTHPMKTSLSLLEPLLLCPGSRTPNSVELYKKFYPCSCKANELMEVTAPTLIICWDISDILLMGLPSSRSQVLVIPLLPLLALQWMIWYPQSFKTQTPATEDQIRNIKLRRYLVHEAFFVLFDIPGWYRVELTRRSEEVEKSRALCSSCCSWLRYMLQNW